MIDATVAPKVGFISPFGTTVCNVNHINAAAQLRLKAPGSQGMLPYPSPLRTVHESRPSHGSSPYCLLSMSLVVCVMTPSMHKHAVLLAIVTALVSGGDVVIIDRIAVVERHLA
jgi:hypothetical protein